MTQGIAIVLFLAVIIGLASVNPKAAGALAAITGLLLYSQVQKGV